MANDHVLEGVSPKETTPTAPQDPIRRSSETTPAGISTENIYSKEESTEKRAIPELHAVDNTSEPSGRDVEAGRMGKFGELKRKLRPFLKHFVYAFIWLLFTGWWIAGLILHRYDLGWLIPFLLYLAITLRMIFLYVPISLFTKPVHFVWKSTASRFVALIPEKLRIPAGGLLTISVIIIGSFASAEAPGNSRSDRAVSLFGLVVFLFVLWVTSRNHKMINWHTVVVGMLVQFIIALFVLRTKAGYDIFDFVSMLARELLGFAQEGVDFLTTPNFIDTHGYFLVSVIPAIIFFVSLVQLLYYIGVLQWAIRKLAVFFFWSMRVSGAEAVVAAASPFIGQGESAMLIKPFIAHCTMAEIHQIMCSGFATIAGSVLVSYLGMGVNPQALISSCVMSIPASLACSKLRWPETEETLTAGRVVIPDDSEDRPSNLLDAFAKGAWLGVKIAGMIAATLLCIISLIGLIDGLLTWWGRYLNINDPTLTLDLIVGYICYPIAFLLGVSREGDDLLNVGKLIGLKLVANEFVAYDALQTQEQFASLSTRSRLIATYALCGFANIGSLGNQIGVLAQLAPSRSGDVSRVAVSAMLTGAISTFTSATIAGLLIQNESQFVTASTAA
ncbi:Na+ dependent nucleoside transporter C-terminus-domain-containing protein [Aspergillus crustosus]